MRNHALSPNMAISPFRICSALCPVPSSCFFFPISTFHFLLYAGNFSFNFGGSAVTRVLISKFSPLSAIRPPVVRLRPQASGLRIRLKLQTQSAHIIYCNISQLPLPLLALVWLLASGETDIAINTIGEYNTCYMLLYAKLYRSIYSLLSHHVGESTKGNHSLNAVNTGK